MVIRAHYDGKAIVPDADLDLPRDQALEVEVRVLSPEETFSQAPPAAAKAPISSLPFNGMWADREDMKDSVAWVRKERRRWNKRLTRRA
jgi:hypothetical protein